NKVFFFFVESPFEFRALEVALEAICSYLDARTSELETAAYPALDELTSKVRTNFSLFIPSLYWDELEQLLDDDDDMADLYLSRKLAGASSPVSGSSVPNWLPASPTIGSRISRVSRASAATIHGNENDVEELEILTTIETNLFRWSFCRDLSVASCSFSSLLMLATKVLLGHDLLN
ncbi:hypothetical protein B296_00055242, partial [Ensete ventricosum]